MKKPIKQNLSDKDFDELFDNSRDAIKAKRKALSAEELKRIDDNPTLERWEGEAETTNEGEDK